MSEPARLLTAIADARLDSVPLVAITGQVSQALIGTDAFQEVDTYGLTLPVTKHNFLVRRPAELLEIVPLARRSKGPYQRRQLDHGQVRRRAQARG